jgi:hypothetical protein
MLDVPGMPIGETGSIADFALRTHDSLAGGSRCSPAGSSIGPEQKFSHYVIKRRVGSGAMGEVWLAFDTTLERELAIKILPPSLGADQERLLRFFREARLAAQLNHPHTVTIYQVGVEEGLPFLAMELVDGGSLEDRIGQQGPLAWQEATRVIRDAAAGLAEAHALGLVHRDIKPANLLQSTKGVTKVADFGLARAASQQSSLTSAGTPLGTPAYMPPEQWKGEAVDGRSDLYSLACTYYYLLTGRPPFDAPSAPALGYQHTHVPFPDARQLRPETPDAVCQIIARGTQKDPSQRYQAASELVAELDSLLAAAGSVSGQSSGAVLPGPVATAESESAGHKRPPRDRRLLWGAGMAAALVCGVIIYITSQGRTTKIELDDPDAIVKVQRPKDGQNAAALPANAAGIAANASAAINSALPTFDDLAPPPPLPPWLSKIAAKDAIPDAALIEQAEAKIRDDFKQRQSAAALADNATLAKELLTLAAVHQPAARFAHLRMARTLAIEASDAATAFEACNELASAFEVDEVRMKATALSKCPNAAQGPPEARDAYAEQCLQVAFEAIAREDYRYVAALVRLLRMVPDGSRMPYYRMRTDFLEREAASSKAAYEGLGPLAERRRQQPDDAEANRAVGAFLCLAKNDWQRGLPMLERGDDAELAELAKREHSRPSSSVDQIGLGDAWWDHAMSADPDEPPYAIGMRQRARYWYLKALSQLSAAERVELARRLQPRIDAVPSEPVVLRIRMQHCDGPHVLEISNDGIETLSNRYGTRTVQINHRSWRREVHGHANSGAERLYPSAVDFTTATLGRENAGRWGWISYQIAPDRFTLHLGHGPTGATEFDVMVLIQSEGFTLANRFEGLWETKFYKGTRQEWAAPDGIRSSAGWDKLMLAGPVDTRLLDQLNFRSDNEPYGVRFKPLSDQVPYDYYAIVATSQWTLPAGDYGLIVRADDGVRVFIDDKKVIDAWKIRGAETDRTTVTLSEGAHQFRVEYFQFDKSARLQFHLRRHLDGDRRP